MPTLQRPSNVNMHSDPVLFIVCFCYLLVSITTQLQLHVTCNGLMTVYNGKLQPEQLITANISANYTIIPGTEILAVRCKNFESKPLILASLSNGMITDSRWKCFSFPNNEYFTGVPWTRTEFNDSHWAQAVAEFSNRGESPAGKVPGIKDEALWISTAEDNPKLFCRRNLSDDDTNLPLQSEDDRSRPGMTMKILIFSVANFSNNIPHYMKSMLKKG